MINKIFSKVLVIVIIFLFVGTFFTPILSKNINNTNEIVIINNNEEFVSGEFIVKFNPEINIEISKSPGGWKTTGISSIDTLNEKYQVSSIEKVFRSVNGYLRKYRRLSFSVYSEIAGLDVISVHYLVDNRDVPVSMPASTLWL